MIAYRRVKQVVLATEDPTDRKVRFMALLNSSMPKGGRRPVLTGGSAIEVYLDGILRTGDMDIVYPSASLELALRAWHFSREHGLRSCLNEELGLSVDMVGEDLRGSYDLVTTITTDFGPAVIIGVEDLILKRLASAKFWKVPSDMEQAYLLAKAHEGDSDWGYLEAEARKQDLTDYLNRLKGMVGSPSKGNRTRSAR